MNELNMQRDDITRKKIERTNGKKEKNKKNLTNDNGRKINKQLEILD